MPASGATHSIDELLSPERLAPSAALFATTHALAKALAAGYVDGAAHDQQTIDLLLRIQVSADGSCRVVDLAEQLMVSPSHMTRVVDKVEALGLVERVPDPSDRRVRRVVATEAGRGALREVAPGLATTLDRVIHETITASEVSTLIDLLGRLELAARSFEPEGPA